MSTETANTWLLRSYTEAANSWGGDLGTAATPKITGGTHNIGSVADILTDKEYTIKSVRLWGSQQGSAGDRSLEFSIMYVNAFTVGTDVLKTDTGSGGFYDVQTAVGVDTFTITDDWTISTKNATNHIGKTIPKDAFVIVSYRVIGSAVNNCSVNATIVLESCARGGSQTHCG
jgi:hypothetical protein